MLLGKHLRNVLHDYDVWVELDRDPREVSEQTVTRVDPLVLLAMRTEPLTRRTTNHEQRTGAFPRLAGIGERVRSKQIANVGLRYRHSEISSEGSRRMLIEFDTTDNLELKPWMLRLSEAKRHPTAPREEVNNANF
jgi:hypothetical protein